MRKFQLLVSALFCLALPVQAQQAAPLSKPEGAAAYIISPKNGETVSSPVTVRFGLKGMGVAPAGIENPKTGHHHLLVDKDVKDLDLKAPLPANDQVRHFGGGQTETSVELKPGPHTLQMLLGDHRHISFDPPVVSEKITITVK
jgi:hypothetical protein